MTVPSARGRKWRWPAVAVAAGALLIAALATGTAVADAPANAGKSKASSFAPHHTKRHAYGAPVSKPILHKQKKHPRSAAPPAPIK